MTTDQFLQFLDSKPNHATKAIKDCLKDLEIGDEAIKADLTPTELLQRTRISVPQIKKYDVIKVLTIGLVHYVLVHRVKDGLVQGLVMTSKPICSTVMQIAEDRCFKGKFITNTYMCWPESECLNCFISVFESKKEANIAFQLVKNYYKNIFK